MEQRQNMTVRLLGALLTACLFGPLLLASCVKLPHQRPETASQTAPRPRSSEASSTPRININTASAEELERLPGIGRALAARIISYRRQYGRFRRAEHLIMVRGIGDRRFRRLYPYITSE